MFVSEQRKSLTSTPVTTTPSAVPTMLHPRSTRPSTTFPGEGSTRWGPGARCRFTAPGHASTSQPPPPTLTRCRPRHNTPAPLSTGRRAASAHRTSWWHSGRGTPCPACLRISNTSTTKPWWAPAGAPTHRRCAGEAYILGSPGGTKQQKGQR